MRLPNENPIDRFRFYFKSNDTKPWSSVYIDGKITNSFKRKFPLLYRNVSIQLQEDEYLFQVQNVDRKWNGSRILARLPTKDGKHFHKWKYNIIVNKREYTTLRVNPTFVNAFEIENSEIAIEILNQVPSILTTQSSRKIRYLVRPLNYIRKHNQHFSKLRYSLNDHQAIDVIWNKAF